MSTTTFDQGNIIRAVVDPSTEALKVLGTGGVFVPDNFDEIDITYVAAGNGIGEISTVVYSLATVTVATLTFTYDAQDRLSNVVRS